MSPSGRVSAVVDAASAVRAMVAWDLRVQYRYRLHAVYAVLTAAFVAGLHALPTGLREGAAVLLIVLDPTVLGFYFVAALVLVEKREGVLDALAVSPLTDRGYLASKVVTLSLLAVAAATLVALLGVGAVPGLPVLVAGVALSASLFVLLGFVAVARFDSVNAYFLAAVGWGTVLFLPLFGYLGLVETPLFALLPAAPVLLLVEGGFRRLTLWELGYGFGYLLVANGVAAVWARRSFRRHVVRGHGASRELAGTTRPRRSSTETRTRGRRSPAARVTGLVAADLRNWLRDPMLVLAAVGPLVLAVLLRVGLPSVTALATPVVALEPFVPTISGAMAVFAPSIYGFVVGMSVLEDREQGVLTAFRTSPLTGRGYLRYRVTTAYLLSLAATLPALAVVGGGEASPSLLFATAAVGALGGPTVALAFATLATDTVEGLALGKLLNLLVLVPAAAVAAVPAPFQLVAGVSPTFWPVKAYVVGVSGGDPVPFLLGGLVVHALALAALRAAFLARID